MITPPIISKLQSTSVTDLMDEWRKEPSHMEQAIKEIAEILKSDEKLLTPELAGKVIAAIPKEQLHSKSLPVLFTAFKTHHCFFEEKKDQVHLYKHFIHSFNTAIRTQNFTLAIEYLECLPLELFSKEAILKELSANIDPNNWQDLFLHGLFIKDLPVEEMKKLYLLMPGDLEENKEWLRYNVTHALDRGSNTSALALLDIDTKGLLTGDIQTHLFKKTNANKANLPQYLQEVKDALLAKLCSKTLPQAVLERAFGLALLDNQVDIVRALLEANVNPNSNTANIELAMQFLRFDAVLEVMQHKNFIFNSNVVNHLARYGTSEVLEKLSSFSIDWNQLNSNDHTPLYDACQFGNVAAIPLLLKAGAKTSETDFADAAVYRNLALYGIPSPGNWVEKELKKTTTADSWKNVIRTVIKEKDYPIEKMKKLYGLMPENNDELKTWFCKKANKMLSKDNKTVALAMIDCDLESAVTSEVYQQAFAVPVDPQLQNIKDAFINKAIESKSSDALDLMLFSVIAQNDLESVKRLIENGANLNACSEDTGEKPIAVAMQQRYVDPVSGQEFQGNWDIIKLMMSHKDVDGAEVLYDAAYNHVSPKIFEKILEKGFKEVPSKFKKEDLNRVGYAGKTPLHLIIHKKLIPLLIQYGANIEAKDDYGRTPLHDATGTDIVLLDDLVLRGANVNARNLKNETPLTLAWSRGNWAQFEYLLLSGAEITPTDLSYMVEKLEQLLLHEGNIRDKALEKLVRGLSFIVSYGPAHLRELALEKLRKHMTRALWKDMIYWVASRYEMDAWQKKINRTEPPKNIPQDAIKSIYLLQPQGNESLKHWFTNAAGTVLKSNEKHLSDLTNKSQDNDTKIFPSKELALVAIDCDFEIVVGSQLAIDAFKAPKNADGKRAPPYQEIKEIIVKKALESKSEAIIATVLSSAIYSGDLETVQELLDNGANPNFQQENGDTPISLAMEVPIHSDSGIPIVGNLKIIELLMSHKDFDFDQKFANGDTILHLALEKNVNPEILQKMLDKGLKKHVNTKNSLQETPLHRVRSRENALILHKLGADLEAVDKNGLTPLYRAVTSDFYNMRAVVEVLASIGADVNVKVMGQTPLMWCLTPVEGESNQSTNEKTAMAKMLLRVGADLTIQDYFGKTALDYATTPAQLTLLLCKCLPSQRALVEENIRTRLASHQLTSDDWEDIVKEAANTEYAPQEVFQTLYRLKPGGAKFDEFWTKLAVKHLKTRISDCQLALVLIDHLDTTFISLVPLWEYIIKSPEAKKALIKKAIDPATKLETRKKVLCKAASSGYVDIAKALFASGLSSNTTDENGTPLIILAFQGHAFFPDRPGIWLIIKELISHADFDLHKKYSGKNLLHFAVTSNLNPAQMAWILDQGFSEEEINEKEERTGETPLILACQKSASKELISVLLAHEADPNLADNHLQTPLHHAKTGDAVVELVKHKANLEAVDDQGLTPLQNACPEIIESLLECGANPFVMHEGVTFFEEYNSHASLPLNTLALLAFWGLQNGTTQQIQQVTQAITTRLASGKTGRGKELLGKLIKLATEKKDVSKELVEKIYQFGAGQAWFPDLYLTNAKEALKNGNSQLALVLIDHDITGSLADDGIVDCAYEMGNEEIKAALAAKIPALANDNTTKEAMLCKAAAKGDSTLVRLLLENGTNPNSSIREKNPCVLAMLGSHWDLVKELMAHKNFDFSVEFTDFANRTLLHMAASNEAPDEILTTLLEKEIPVNGTSLTNITPLHTASAHNSVSVVRFLLKNGANVRAITTEGKTPLHEAVKSNNLKIIDTLIDADAEIEAIDQPKGKTPFLEACCENQFNAAHRLLQRGANLLTQDSDNNTVLKLDNPSEAMLLVIAVHGVHQKKVKFDDLPTNDSIQILQQMDQDKLAPVLPLLVEMPKVTTNNFILPFFLPEKHFKDLLKTEAFQEAFEDEGTIADIMPVYIDYLAKKGPQAVDEFKAHLLTWLRECKKDTPKLNNAIITTILTMYPLLGLPTDDEVIKATAKAGYDPQAPNQDPLNRYRVADFLLTEREKPVEPQLPIAHLSKQTIGITADDLELGVDPREAKLNVVFEANAQVNTEEFKKSRTFTTQQLKERCPNVNSETWNGFVKAFDTRIAKSNSTVQKAIYDAIEERTELSKKSFIVAKEIIQDKKGYVTALCRLPVDPNASIPTVQVCFFDLVNYLSKQSDTIVPPAVLSEREILMVRWMNIMRACVGGKEELIIELHHMLVKDGQIEPITRGENTTKEAEIQATTSAFTHEDEESAAKDKVAKAKMESTIAILVDDVITHTFATESPMMRKVTGVPTGAITQLVHQSIYIKNLIGNEIGISGFHFEEYSHCLYQELLKLTKQSAVDLFWSYHPPGLFVDRVKYEINRQVVEEVKEQQQRIGKKRAELKGLKPLELAHNLQVYLEGEDLGACLQEVELDVFDPVKKANTTVSSYILTDYGALRILKKSGFLTVL